MGGRPKLYDEVEVIDKAINVFWDKNYDVASSDELLNVMGIGKSSFYFNFKGGKQELYERTLKRFAEKLNSKMERGLDKADDTINYIKQYFISGANSSILQKDRGCYYGNALIQLSEKDSKVKTLAASILEDMQRIFTKAIRIAQERGQISRSRSAESLGLHLINFWNGIPVTRRMERSPAALLGLIDLNFGIIK
jgi:TetR/AcrR family transcriptional regulator, transcriptional repressor for nem operon